jgi:Gnt-I system low-affinity gluconate transporter
MDYVIDNRVILATLGSVGMLLFLVVKTRMHAFPALILVSILGALAGGMSTEDALQTVTNGMGGTLGFISIVIGLGAMFGVFLQAGGGVQTVAIRLLSLTGISGSRWSIGIVGLLVAIPVFFDVALIILAPIIFSLAQRTKTAPLVFGLPLLAGLATAHAFIPPTPGPIAVAELLNADLGWVILFGLAAGIPAMIIAGPVYTGFAQKIGWIANHEDSGSHGLSGVSSDAQQRSAFTCLVIIAIPLLLIVGSTVSSLMLSKGSLLTFANFIGHPFVALLIACGVAYFAFKPKSEGDKRVFSGALSKALEPAGAVILITGAGGAFKQVLVETGAGKLLAEMTLSIGLTPLIAGFVLALLVRVAQGSATVAMITAAGLTAPLLELASLNDAQTSLVVIAIASGATACSHVNDSGFWLVSRYFNLTEIQTLRTWTVSATLIGLTGLVVSATLMLIV